MWVVSVHLGQLVLHKVDEAVRSKPKTNKGIPAPFNQETSD